MKNKSTKRLLILIGLVSLATLLMVFYPAKKVTESIYVLEGEVPEVYEFKVAPNNDYINVKLISDKTNVVQGEKVVVQVLVDAVSNDLNVYGFNFQINFPAGIRLVDDSVNIPNNEFFKGYVSSTDDTNVLVYFVANKDSYLNPQISDELLNFEVEVDGNVNDGKYVVSFDPNFEQFVGDSELPNMLATATDLTLNVGTTVTKVEPPTINKYVPTTYDSQIKITGEKEDGIGIKVDGEVIVVEESKATTWEVTLPLAMNANLFAITAFKGEDSSTPITVSINRHMVADINGDTKIDVFDLGVFGNQYYIFQSLGRDVNASDPSNLRLSDMNKPREVNGRYGDGKVDVFDLGVFGKAYYEYNKTQ